MTTMMSQERKSKITYIVVKILQRHLLAVDRRHFTDNSGYLGLQLWLTWQTLVVLQFGAHKWPDPHGPGSRYPRWFCVKALCGSRQQPMQSNPSQWLIDIYRITPIGIHRLSTSTRTLRNGLAKIDCFGYRCLLTPHEENGQRVSDIVQIHRRPLLWPLLPGTSILRILKGNFCRHFRVLTESAIGRSVSLSLSLFSCEDIYLGHLSAETSCPHHHEIAHKTGEQKEEDREKERKGRDDKGEEDKNDER